MNLQCPECGYQLLAEQARCPECGSDAAPLTAIAAGRTEDLRWHRGWTSLGCVFVVCAALAVGGLSMVTRAPLAVALPCGAPMLLLGAFGLYGFVRETVRRFSGPGKRPDLAGFDAEYFYADLGAPESHALAAIERVQLEATRRADRWLLQVTIRPDAATFAADEIERRWEGLGSVSLSGEGGVAGLHLAATGDEARAFADALEHQAHAARSARIPVDDDLVRELLDPEGTGTPAVRDWSGREVLRVGIESLVVTTLRRRLIPCSRVTDLELAGGGQIDARGGVRLWRWFLMVRQKPYVDAGLRIDRRPISVRFAHEDPRAGAALWSVLMRRRPDE